MPWDEIVIKHIKLIQKGHFSQSMMFPFILGISFVNSNQPLIPANLSLLTKESFKGKHHI